MGYKIRRILPGQKAKEVLRWAVHDGITYCLRKQKVRRSYPPECGFTSQMQYELDENERLLKEVKAKGMSTQEHINTLREGQISQYTSRIEELKEARQPITDWEDEQIRRCLHGYGTMTGFHYMYYHLGWIQEVNEATSAVKNIRPLYRSADDWFFRAMQKAIEDSTGIVMPKKRRFGASWLLVCIVAWSVIFRGNFIFFVTKDEEDQEKFYRRLDYFMSKLPPFMQKLKDRNAMDFKSYYPSQRIADVLGIDIEEVPMAVVRSATPKTESNVEGDGCGLFIIDEGGKIPNLRRILQLGLPMLAGSDGWTRAGCMVVTGTVGKMDISGRVLKKVFDTYKSWQLIPIRVPGWMGFRMDELGNDDKERSTREIKARRSQYERDNLIQELAELKQQYPLEAQDYWSTNNTDKIMPTNLLDQALMVWDMPDAPVVEYGLFRWDDKGRVVFDRQEPNPSGDPRFEENIGWGQVAILEHPNPNTRFRTPYACGVDPVDLEIDKYKENESGAKFLHSDFSFVIRKRAADIGQYTDIPVCWYAGRPGDPEDAFEQCALACIYYLNAMQNIERQTGKLLYSYLKNDPRFAHLIFYGSGLAQGQETSRTNWGFHNTDNWWSYGIGIAKKWLRKNYYHPIPKRLINEYYDLKERNTDLAVADIACLQLCRELDAREKQGMEAIRDQEEENQDPLDEYAWEVNKQGYLLPKQISDGHGLKDVSSVHNFIRKQHGLNL